MPKLCPCTSGLTYRACCAPFHRGEREAETPQALMRSRFAAFALGDAEYLWRTLHPDHEEYAEGEVATAAAVKNAARSLKYMRLRILDAQGDRVLFLASVFEKGRDRSFIELSTFARDGSAARAGWRYLEGDARDATSVGDPAKLTIQSFLSG